MAEESLVVVLTPVQLAAVISGQNISESETSSNRLWGGLTLLGGALEMVGAGALWLAPEPTMLTKAGGTVLGAHGADTISSGFWQLWTGQRQRTLTDQAAESLALRLGASADTAGKIGAGIDIAVPLVVSLGIGAARVAAIRAGRISLIEHEAAAGSRLGGHTLAKHVGQSEAALRARLARELRIPAASTFKSLDVAERTLYSALKSNRAAIETWARTAAPGRTKAFQYTASEVVGHGVVRATNLLTQTKKIDFVLKMEAYNGKLYYILTAFPSF
jgi:hypothetical protein